MAVTLTGTGGLFTRIGALISEYNRVVSAYGSSLTTGVEAIWDQYPNSNQDGIAVDGLLTARDNYRTVHSSYITALTNAATNTVVEQVNRDTALPAKTLSYALNELKTQMVSSTDDINRPTVAGTVTAYGSNKGNANVLVSLVNEKGDPTDMVLAETIKFNVTGDTSNGGTQYAETITVVGQPVKAANAYDWPGGSGASTSMVIKDATTDGIATDGSFEDWDSSTVPTNWTVSVGSSTVSRDATNIIRGTYGLKITSDGSTLTTLRQQLSTSLLPNNVICVNLWGKTSVNDSSAVVRVRLTNSAGTTLTNDAATSLTTNIGCNGGSGFDTTFARANVFFQLPRQLPATGGVWLEIGFTTAMTSTRTLTLDHVGVVLATRLYAGGPYAAAFSKDTANAVGDYYSLAVTNSLDHRSFVRSLDRLFNMRSLGIYLPSDSSSPSISDSLIS